MAGVLFPREKGNLVIVSFCSAMSSNLSLIMTAIVLVIIIVTMFMVHLCCHGIHFHITCAAMLTF